MIPPKADAGEAMQANHEPATEAVSASDWWGAGEGDDGDRPELQRNDGRYFLLTCAQTSTHRSRGQLDKSSRLNGCL